jgi:hypothetical protein
MVMAGVSVKLVCFQLAGDVIGLRAEESDLDMPDGGAQTFAFHALERA